jgi:hypothetical protein
MLEVTREMIVAADPREVWSLTGNFGAIAEWHPACAASSQETVGDSIQRTITVGDGARLIEKLESRDDANMTLSYSIIDGPLPVKNYLSTYKVEKHHDGSKITWSGRFDGKDATDERAKQVIAGIYTTGLDALKKRFG